MGAVLMTIYPDDTNKLVILASIGKPTQLGQCLDEWNLAIISIRMMMIIIIIVVVAVVVAAVVVVVVVVVVVLPISRWPVTIMS